MPPKRIVKNAGKPKAPPQLVNVNNDQTTEEATEAELKFDQEVLWCISQFEKLVSSGKLPEAKSKYQLITMKLFMILTSMILIPFPRARKHQSHKYT
jgi:hypothetical protein